MPKDYSKVKFAEMADDVVAMQLELKRRNPIGVNLYVPAFVGLALDLREIATAEKENPTCETVVRVKPEIRAGSTVPINEILSMDGRKTAPRVRIFRPFPSSPPKISMVKFTIKRFLANGESGRHSENAILLRYIVAYCEANNIGYVLTRVVFDGRAAGYHIKRLVDVSLDVPSKKHRLSRKAGTR